MDYYELLPGVYRIQAGVGPDGEIFGGIFLDDTPGIIIGCSGGLEFARGLENLLNDLNFSKDIRLYLPVVTYEEIKTLVFILKKFSNIGVYVHVTLLEEMTKLREKFPERYILSEREQKYLQKNLPKSIENVIGFDKGSSFETEKTKLLIIPFDGPHIGHSFIYSRDHKLLCTGLIFGRTSNPRTYYIDKTGSIFHYQNALSFVEGAKCEAVFPIYDEPEFTSDVKYKTVNVNDALKYDRNTLLDVCSSKPKSVSEILDEYMKLVGERFETDPYDKIDLNRVKVYKHLEQLVDDKQLVKEDNQYRSKK